ncbi:MAG TPA: 8-oxoguanine deaminase [Chloroflexota bacterium]|nr:8-oxoguanine deaminase [Chloroflexota bacterium]
MSTQLFANYRYLATMDDAGTELRNGFVLVEDGWITHVGTEPPTHSVDRRVDCAGYIVIPGLVNAHHHLYQTLTRAFPESTGVSLFPWLEMLYPIWAGLDEDMIYASTRAGLAELALSGCTTSADHLYVFPSGSDGFVDAEIRAAQDIGLRFHATRGSMDLSEKDGGLPPDQVVQPIDEILAETVRLIQHYHDPSPGAHTRIGVAPCSPFSASTQLMRESASLAREYGVRLHTHIAETKDEDTYSRERFGLSPVELLDSVEWVASDVWLAHCVHPSEGDVRLLAGGGSAVAHCPTSNMLLGSGLAPTPRLLAAGVQVGLGVDGSSSNDGNDLRNEMKQSLLSARVRDGANALSARQALWMATRGGAACLGRDDIGAIEPGRAADLVLFEADDLALAGGEEDMLAAIVLCSARPASVYVHGRQVVSGGRLLSADVDEIAGQQRAASRRLLERGRGG